MKKVAICLSGEARSLEVTKQYYESFNKIEGYEFSFFIATWDSNFNKQVQSFLNLKKYCILKEKDYLKHTSLGKISNNFKYSFLLKKCNLLKQQYELENNIQFDCVIITRIDTIILNQVRGLEQFFNDLSYVEFNPLVSFTGDNMRYNQDHAFMDDNFIVLNSLTSDIYSNIHFFYYGNTMNKRNFSLEINAYMLRYYSIVNNNSSAHLQIIRPCAVYDWLDKLKDVDYLSKNFDNIFNPIKKSINNNRIQSRINGAVIFDLRKKNFILDKLGYLSFLEVYLDNVAMRYRDTNTTLLVDQGIKIKIEKLNLQIRGKQKDFNIIENRTLKKVLQETNEQVYFLASPKHFLSFQHNNFYSDANNYDLSILTHRGEILKSCFAIKNSFKDKLIESDFDSIEEIDFKKLSSKTNNIQKQEVIEVIDLEQVKSIYQQVT